MLLEEYAPAEAAQASLRDALGQAREEAQSRAAAHAEQKAALSSAREELERFQC